MSNTTMTTYRWNNNRHPLPTHALPAVLGTRCFVTPMLLLFFLEHGPSIFFPHFCEKSIHLLFQREREREKEVAMFLSSEWRLVSTRTLPGRNVLAQSQSEIRSSWVIWAVVVGKSSLGSLFRWFIRPLERTRESRKIVRKVGWESRPQNKNEEEEEENEKDKNPGWQNRDGLTTGTSVCERIWSWGVIPTVFICNVGR